MAGEWTCEIQLILSVGSKPLVLIISHKGRSLSLAVLLAVKHAPGEITTCAARVVMGSPRMVAVGNVAEGLGW